MSNVIKQAKQLGALSAEERALVVKLSKEFSGKSGKVAGGKDPKRVAAAKKAHATRKKNKAKADKDEAAG
jgi:hypothetical protein